MDRVIQGALPGEFSFFGRQKQQVPSPPTGIEPGRVIDDFKLIAPIGQGGMGQVWEAEQVSLNRRVALKLVRPDRVNEHTLDLFSREARAGGRLSHSGIVRIHGHGEAEGVAWISMELVEGAWTLKDFIDETARGGELPDGYYRRVAELVVDLADAMQAAHEANVIHRDLKPANVLITPDEHPKVTDFGLAKITDETALSVTGDFAGTYAYMSPEQAMAKRMGLDHRTDIFSLGVVLYEMLTLRRPFEGDTSAQVAQQIMLNDPPDPVSLRSRTPPDLAVISGKCLEKEMARRYQTMAELAADIRRHLSNEPILAKPPTVSQRATKWVRRNPTKSGMGMVAAIALVAIVALWLRAEDNLDRAVDAEGATAVERDRALEAEKAALTSETQANREAETSRQALGFMTGMFEVSDPSQARGETVTAREILDQGAARIDRELKGQPEVRSTLMATMGSVYRGLGLYDRAEELMSSAASIQRDLYGEEHPETLRLSAGIADLWTRKSRLEESEELLRETLEAQQRVLGPDHVDVLDSRLSLSRLLELRSEFDEAEALARETLEAARRTLGEDHELTLLARNRLGLAYEASGRFDEAEEQFLKVLEVRRRTLGGDHPETLLMIANLGELYMNMGRFEEAEGLFDEAQETARLVFGDEHPSFVMYRSKLGLLYFEQGRWEEAEEVYRAIIEIQRRTLGDDHLDTLLSLNTLGVVLVNQDRLDEAEPYYLEALEGLLREVGEQNEHTLTIFGNMAMFYLQADRLEEAETWGWKTYEGSKALHGEDHPETILRLENLANVIYKQGDEVGAVEILEQVLEGRRRALGNEHPAVTRTLVNLSVVRGTIGDPEGATAVREELLERTLAGLGFDYATVAEEIEDLARDLVRAGEYERASDCLVEILRIRLETLGAEDPSTLTTMRDGLQVAIYLERWAAVEALGRECYETHVRVLGAADSKTEKCLQLIVEGYEKQGDEVLAETWRAKLQDGEDER